MSDAPGGPYGALQDILKELGHVPGAEALAFRARQQAEKLFGESRNKQLLLYRDRNLLTQLAASFASRLGLKVWWCYDSELQQPREWPLFYIELPGVGQVSWHLSTADVVDLPSLYLPDAWDRHTMPQKLERVQAYLEGERRK